MNNLPNDHQNNLVSFLRQNRPLPPTAAPGLEQQLLASLEPRTVSRRKYSRGVWTISSAIATGFLFTSVSFGLKTPRIALEPKDLENFIVGNWHSTLGYSSVNTNEEVEAHWLLPTIAELETNTALSVSAK